MLLSLLGAAAEPNLDWLAPVASGISLVIVGALSTIAGVQKYRRDRRDTTEDREVDELPLARREVTHYYHLYRAFEELFYATSSALRTLARSVHQHHPEEDLGKEVMAALALRPPADGTE